MYHLNATSVSGMNTKADFPIRNIDSQSMSLASVILFKLIIFISFVYNAGLGRNTSDSVIMAKVVDQSEKDFIPPSVWNETCPASNTPYNYTGINGSIVWDEALCPDTCSPCEFVLHVPDDHELIIEFHDFDFWFKPGRPGFRFFPDDVLSYDEEQWQARDKVDVECVDMADLCASHPIMRTIQGKLPVAPVWAQNVSRIRLRLYTSRQKRLAATRTKNITLFSRFNISYRTIKRQPIPQFRLLPQDRRYWNYCPLSFDIPIGKCDMVGQCYTATVENNPALTYYDERNCEYESEGCGPGLAPFRDECFGIRREPMPNLMETVSSCVFWPDTPFSAAFLDPSVRDFIVEKAVLTGLRDVLMGVERMKTASDTRLRHLYRFLWWWKPYKTVVYDPSLEQYGAFSHDCAALHFSPSGHVSMRSLSCNEITTYKYLQVCHKYNRNHTTRTYRDTKLRVSPATTLPGKFSTKLCPGGFHVHPFHPCDEFSADAGQLSSAGLPVFHCDNGAKLHYSLTCDGYDDCDDKSDEVRCDTAKHRVRDSPLSGRFFVCEESLEIMVSDKKCDGMPDCMDSSDEDRCARCRKDMMLFAEQDYFSICIHQWDKLDSNFAVWKWFDTMSLQNVDYISIARFKQKPVMDELRLWRVELNGFGGSYLQRLVEGEECPETHVRCPNAYCIPTYMLNNGVYDCPYLDTDDEHVADKFTCPGFYRCYRSHICVHNHYLCDGVHHCPLKDDERYCDVSRTCPDGCTCEGLAMTCGNMTDPSQHPYVRYLDVSRSYQPRLDNLHLMVFLQFLNLSGCSLQNLTLTHMDHLKVLDVSRNHLRTLSSTTLLDMIALRHLDLSDNSRWLTSEGLLADLLRSPGIQHNLETLVLENTGLTVIEPNTFEDVAALRYLDLKRNDIVSVEKNGFYGLAKLELLEADDITLCCFYSKVYPTSLVDCQAPEDELSSCGQLLRSSFFRAGLWTISVCALLGNGGVLIYRLLFETQGTSLGFRVLVTNLGVSDFAMGVYLMMIGSADLHYSGQYSGQRTQWTHSATCLLAGFLALLSSEVSAFIICLITLDRLLVMLFPLRHGLHLTRKSAMMACCAAWGLGLVLAAVPLLPFTADWEFYSQNGICLPLPITRRRFPGQGYTFAVFIVLNFSLFLLIGVGQMSILRAIRNTVFADRTQRRQQDTAIARRLLLIAVTDFCCWFPVGVMALLAVRGTPIPGIVNVATAVFVLPLNSALNPFLYTLNVVLRRRSKAREQRRIQTLMTSLQTDVNTWPPDRLDELFHNMLKARRLDIREWSVDQTMQLFRSWPDDKVRELLREFGSRTGQEHHGE